jgi:ABC-type xylose transport system permease subunit
LTTMLKNTALLALVGMVLVTILLIVHLIGDVSGVLQGLIPAVRVLTSFIYAFAGLSVVIFLYAFHKAQP